MSRFRRNAQISLGDFGSHEVQITGDFHERDDALGQPPLAIVDSMVIAIGNEGQFEIPDWMLNHLLDAEWLADLAEKLEEEDETEFLEEEQYRARDDEDPRYDLLD